MRFDHLNIRAFGHFTDYELTFDSSKNFHLLYGPNEAGKSTTLRSITNFLYGFPSQTNDTFLHSNTKLRIEGELKKSNGDQLHFARRKGNKNTVLDLNDKPMNEDLVNEFLNGISKEHFLNMFALNHETLREGGDGLLESGGNLGESLFSAASGISMLRKVFEDLEKKSGNIYKKRAQTTKLNKLLKEEKDLIKEISENQLKIQAWRDLERTYNDGIKAIEDLKAQIKTLRTEKEKLERVKVTLPKIAKLRDLTEKLSQLGDVPVLPDDIEETRKQAQQKLESAKRDKIRAVEESGGIEKELKKISIPEGLIEQASIIDDLYREVQTYQNHLKELPGIEGERKFLEENVIALMKEIDILHAALDQIDFYRLSTEKKETIRNLGKQKPLLDQELQNIKRELNDKNDELQKKKEEFSNITVGTDIEGLVSVIDRVKRAGNIEETLEKLLHDIQQKEKQILEEISLLPQWSGTYHELLELPVPGLNETIKRFEREQNDLLLKLQRLEDQIRNQKEAIELHEEQIRALESLAEIPSEDTLINVRTRREQGWGFIRRKIQNGSWDEQLGEFTNGQAIETVYEESVRESDHVADKMRLEAAKVGQKNKHLADIVSAKKKINDLEKDVAAINEELVKWETEWKDLWEPTGIIPLSPAEMKEWLEKYSQIKHMAEELSQAQSSYYKLEGEKTKHKRELIEALSSFAAVTDAQSLDELLSIAEKLQKKFLDDFYLRKNLEDSIKEIDNKIKKLTASQNENKQKMDKWNLEWSHAIQGTTISETTPTNVAEGLLSKYEEIVHAYEKLKETENKQKTIKESILLFENKVKNLLKVLNMDENVQNIEFVVNQLNSGLQQAKLDKAKADNLDQQLQKQLTVIKNSLSIIDEANSRLHQLFELAQCTSIEELVEVEQSFKLKKECEAGLKAVQEELLLNGNGKSLESLMEEADMIEQDSISGELEEINRQLDELEDQRSQLYQTHGVVKKEYEDKIQGSNTASVTAEQRKESLFAQLSSLTEQYIQLKLASALLQRGIEHYRNQNQDPILKRASELFARLTLGSFAGLTVDYDDKDQPVLMGFRENGDKVSIDGMSDGTTDQLYLSLRIASIEKYASENEPIPFIVDDILVHFDDYRSKETLKILQELSNVTQIIFFTHHARLVDIMEEISVEKAYQLIEITSNEAVTV